MLRDFGCGGPPVLAIEVALRHVDNVCAHGLLHGDADAAAVVALGGDGGVWEDFFDECGGLVALLRASVSRESKVDLELLRHADGGYDGDEHLDLLRTVRVESFSEG